MSFSGPSQHRCKCFGEGDGPNGTYYPCPPELCEAEALLARAEAAEAEVQRYREGLRELLGPNPNYDPDGQHDYGWENEPPKPFAPRWVRDKVDALLADRPDEPWESFAASQGGIFNGPHPADVEPDGGEAK